MIYRKLIVYIRGMRVTVTSILIVPLVFTVTENIRSV
jgi:hypothetical protein